jgi:hypothetical protein
MLAVVAVVPLTEVHQELEAMVEVALVENLERIV